MKEYLIYFLGNNGKIFNGFFYGNNEAEARRNAIRQGIAPHKIRTIEFYENYRGYGHI